MRSLLLPGLLGLASCLASSRTPEPQDLLAEVGARALESAPIGAYGRPVSGASEEAQAWFDQGLRLLYGFNQDQAAACFARAAQASPDCAMAWWGVAMAYAVDINSQAVTPEEARAAFVASEEALRLADGATAVEQALIRAAATRTPLRIPGDRRALDEAYHAAMRAAWEAHPDDPDVGTLYADAKMLLQPWDYWTWDGLPLGQAEETVTLLERVLAQHPEHPGANHFYIHIMESSSDPWRALTAAERLAGLMPGSGHLVHMPSHIYANTGRYQESVESNLLASELDQEYFASYREPTFYLNYFVHNLHFVVYAAMMEGRLALALEFIQRMEDALPDDLHRAFARFIDGHFMIHAHTLVRFGRWDELLALPEPAEFRHVSRAARRYGRTVALANLGRTDEARSELAAFDEACAAVPAGWSISFNPAQVVLGLARQVAEAELLWREGDPAAALTLLQQAVLVERELVYTEPPPWAVPVRHAIGAIQVATGDGVSAEATYRADLARLPGNAWSLLGLQQALTLQGRLDEAEALQSAVDQAWARADERAPASCYCGVALETP